MHLGSPFLTSPLFLPVDEPAKQSLGRRLIGWFMAGQLHKTYPSTFGTNTFSFELERRMLGQ